MWGAGVASEKGAQPLRTRSRGAQVHNPVLAPEPGIAQPGCPVLSGLDNRACDVNSFPGTAWHSTQGWPGQGNPGEKQLHHHPVDHAWGG